MNAIKREKLDAAGWIVGSVADFVQLTPQEIELFELRLALSKKIRELRTEKQLTQAALAQQIGSSQSRIAKIEAGDPSVSIDLMLRSIFALGMTRRDLVFLLAS